jgi:hypothetical protein
MFQNLKLDGKNLLVQMCEPFSTMLDYKKRPKGWGRLDGFRIFDWKAFQNYAITDGRWMCLEKASHDESSIL